MKPVDLPVNICSYLHLCWLWVVTEKMRSGLNLTDMARSLDTREGRAVVLQHCKELAAVVLASRVTPRCLGKWACPTRRRPGADPGEIVFFGWPGNTLVLPQKNWKRWVGRGRSGNLCSDYCPFDLGPEKQYTMDGCFSTINPSFFLNQKLCV